MSKKKPLSAEQLAECQAAHRLYLERRNELNLSQKKIADEAGISAPAVNLYFKGVNALNVSFALVLSRMLRVPVEEFSPRLAAEINAISQSSLPTPADTANALLDRVTPRSRKIVDRILELERQGRLTDADLALLQGLVERFGKED